MKSEGVGAVPPLAERRGVAKTCWRRRVLWQSGGQRCGPAPVGATRRCGRPGPDPGVLRQGALRVDELTGATESEGRGSHVPLQPAAENRWKLSRPPTES